MATTPRQMKTRMIDNDALMAEIGRQRAALGDPEIHTRAQAMLADAERDRLDLEQKQAAMRQEIERTEKNIAALTELLTAQRAAEADFSIMLNAKQEAIHSLRQSGVTL